MTPSAAPRVRGEAIDVRLFDDLAAIARDAAGGLDRASQPSLYDRLDWLRLTAGHVLPDARLIAARARIGDDRCWLFLDASGSGRSAVAFASWYTLAFAPVFAADPAMHAPLLEAAARALRGRFAGIVLAPLPGDAAALVATAFARAGWWATAEDATANWVAHTAGQDFAAYWAGRPSRLRNTVRRKVRAAGLGIEVHRRFDDAAWSDYEAVYRASWKPAEGSPAFVRALAVQEGDAGTLRLGIARQGGVAVACQLWTVENDVAIIHKLAHLEAERAASPGTVLSEAMFAHVIDRDAPALIDFGTGDDPYKADWMDERRMLRRVTLYDRASIGGISRAARDLVARRLRHG